MTHVHQLEYAYKSMPKNINNKMFIRVFQWEYAKNIMTARVCH